MAVGGGLPRWSGSLAVRVATSLSFLVAIAAAIRIGQLEQAALAGPEETLFRTALHEILATTFLHVGLASAGLWLVVLGRRGGYFIAVLLGVLSLLVYSAASGAPRGAGPPVAPVWLQAIGWTSAAIMTLGGALGLRGGGQGAIDSRRGTP